MPLVGLEPTRENSPDFESGAYTNFATMAYIYHYTIKIFFVK